MDKLNKTIYDFGMNNGDDVAYYLTKADRVVAVEANAALCRIAEKKFESEISTGRLTILNFALSDCASDEPLPCYILFIPFTHLGGIEFGGGERTRTSNLFGIGLGRSGPKCAFQLRHAPS